MVVRVQPDPVDFAAEVAAFTRGAGEAGAVVTFQGIVRGNAGKVERIEIEHYPGMTEAAIAEHAAEAMARFALTDALVVHRHGVMAVGETIMMVATAARHRAEAFAAAEFLMDYLKSRAPFWKKEFGADGALWVAARGADEAALKRW